MDETNFEGTGAKTVVFMGDSLIEWGRWTSAFPGVRSVNLGRCGDTTGMVLSRCAEAAEHDPDAIFLMVGANDLVCGLPRRSMLDNYGAVLGTLRESAPGAKVYCCSLLPSRNGAWGVNNREVRNVNEDLRSLAGQKGCEYLDLHGAFADGDGEMRFDCTDDGVHLSDEGYRVWEEAIRRMVEG